MAKPITNRVKIGKTPVIRKDLEGGVVAEANRDGSIYIDKDVKPGSPLEKEAIAHEKVHLDQMNRGDLDYDDNNVYWKGKKYSRSKMNEGAKNLPWEKEAYDKTKHMNSNRKISAMKMSDADLVAGDKQTHKKFIDYSKGFKTALNMKSTPITKKSKSSSPLHKNGGIETVSTKEYDAIMGGKYGKAKITKSDIAKGFKTGSIPTAKGGQKLATDADKYMAGLRDRFKYATGAELAKGRYISSNRAAEMDTKYPAQQKPQEASTKSSRKVEFKPYSVTEPGKPGKPGTYNMPFYEARNLSLAAKQKRQAQNREIRQATRDYYKIQKELGKKTSRSERKTINPETGQPFTEKEFMQYRSKAKSSFQDPAKKRYGAEMATKPTTRTAKASDAPKGTVVLDSQGNPIYNNNSIKARLNKVAEEMGFNSAPAPTQMNMSNKNPFKMKGYGSKNK